MVLELFYFAFVTTFVGLVVLGHALVIAATYGCAREALGLSDWPSGLGAKAAPQMATPTG